MTDTRMAPQDHVEDPVEYATAPLLTRIEELRAELLDLRDRFDEDGVALARARERIKELEVMGRAMTEVKNAAYAERNKVVAALATTVWACLGFNVRVAEDLTQEEGWRTVLHIQLPTGQVSWHFHDSEEHLLADLPHDSVAWDGHTTEEKYWRLDAWVRDVVST